MDTPEPIKQETFQHLLKEWQWYNEHERALLLWVLEYLILTPQERAEFLEVLLRLRNTNPE